MGVVRHLHREELMTACEGILNALLFGLFCDDCLSELARIRPRQQVNQRCRELALSGRISRKKGSCAKCGRNKFLNQLRASRFASAPLNLDRKTVTPTSSLWEADR